MKLKEKDFVTIEYTGTVDGKIFDLTDEELAKKEGIYKETTRYGPITIVVGAGHMIQGIDKVLAGKEEEEEF